ncbi:OR46A protein, partial [Acromyrmex heyeri]
MDIILIVDNIDDFATNTLMFLTIVAVCCKATIVVIRRNAINNLIQLLMETPCKPRDEDEIAIKTKFDTFIRSCLIKYMLLSMSSLTGVTIGSVVNIMQGYLPYRIWLPFNYTIPLAFWTISIHQIVTLIFATMINVSTDILVLGFFCGIWRPNEWSSNSAKLMYNIFTFIVIFSEYFLVLTQFMDIILIVDNIDDFATNTLMFLTIVAVCCKATVVVVRRSAITNLVQVLMKTPCKPYDEDEVAIQTKYDMFIRSCSIKYSLLVTSSVTGTTIGSVLNIMQGHLPYRIWLPYNYNVSTMFWATSVHQIITVIFSAMINIGTDSLVFGLILHTCAQLKIFESRLHKLMINRTIRYLENTFSPYAKTVNVIFNQVLFVQFFASILVLCTSVYYLSIHITELSGTATFLVYTIGMFVQIYIYCWSGNEVILKNNKHKLIHVRDAIYCMDWPLLSVNEKKELLMVMIRSTIPIKFTSSFLITLSLQSYSNLYVAAVVCKATVVVIRRNAIISLIQVLLKGPCQPQDEDEIAIQTKFDKLCSMEYLLLAMISLTGVIIGSVLNIMQGQLPCRIWLPLDYNVSLMFWIISIQQVIAIIAGTIINVGTETLVFGLILETCAQLEIFENRLHKLINNKTVKYLENAFGSLNEDKTEISKCIRHHLGIYKYAKTVNVIFNQVLFVQFFGSILILCTCIYYLSTHITELSEIGTLLVYIICMFVQIYVYCWSGNEVMLKSMSIGETIYCMDWPLLSITEKKELLMIMIRSTIPIKFTSSFMITLSLQSYSNVILIVDNIDDFATNTLMFLTIVAVCCKATVVVVRRNAIINLVQILLKAPYKPRDEDEVAIQTKFDKFIRSCSIKYSLLATSSVTGTTIGSVLSVMQGHLPYRIWLPCNYNVTMTFWIISVHQILTIIFATIINVGTETLVFGLILQTCAQLEIFKSRLHKFIIKKTVTYLGHARSLYAKTVNIIFNQVLFVQFFSSILVLCTSVYYLSMHIKELSAAASLLVYTICMFVQIFVYCWSGNEVMLKSMSIADAIYNTNWPLLSINEKRGLLMIMIRSTIPVKFTSSFLITLSLQSYSNILKTSYSAFSVLQK